MQYNDHEFPFAFAQGRAMRQAGEPQPELPTNGTPTSQEMGLHHGWAAQNRSADTTPSTRWWQRLWGVSTPAG